MATRKRARAGGSSAASEDLQLELERERLERQGETLMHDDEKQRLSDAVLRLQQEKVALQRQRSAGGAGKSPDSLTEIARLRRDVESAKRRVLERDDELSRVESSLSKAKREAARIREESEDALRDAQDTEREQSARIASLEERCRGGREREVECTQLRLKLEASERERGSLEERRKSTQEHDDESRGLATTNKALASKLRAALNAHKREVKLRKRAEEGLLRLTEESRSIASERERAKARVRELARAQVELKTSQEQLGAWRAALAQTLGALPAGGARAAAAVDTADASAITGLMAALQQRTEAVAAESAALKSKAARDAAESARAGVALAAAEASGATFAAERRALEQRARLADADVALYQRESARLREQVGFLLFTVTVHANHAHNLTRSP